MHWQIIVDLDSLVLWIIKSKVNRFYVIFSGEYLEIFNVSKITRDKLVVLRYKNKDVEFYKNYTLNIVAR